MLPLRLFADLLWLSRDSVMKLVLYVAPALLVGSHARSLTKPGFPASRTAPFGCDEQGRAPGVAVAPEIL